MKFKTIERLLLTGMILSMTAVGCKKNPTYLTNLETQSRGTTLGGPRRNPQDIDTQPRINTQIPPTQFTQPTDTSSGQHTPGIPLGEDRVAGYIHDDSKFSADTAHFDYDSAVVRSADKSKLSDIAAFLKSNAQDGLEIDGHCDERGTEEYNRSLGERRALALRESLAAMGVDPNMIRTVSYGKDRPADSEHNDAAWAKNRRGEFILLTPPKM